MPDAAWAVNGCPPGSSQDIPPALVSTSSFRFSTRQRQRTFVHRSSSRPAPDTIESCLFPRRSPQRSSANAAVGGLKPPPAGRLQRANQPPSLLQRRSQRNHHHTTDPPPAFVFTSGTSRFSRLERSRACMGSPTPRGPTTTRENAAADVAFRTKEQRRHPGL